jgi:hypothetical protein
MTVILFKLGDRPCWVSKEFLKHDMDPSVRCRTEVPIKCGAIWPSWHRWYGDVSLKTARIITGKYRLKKGLVSRLALYSTGRQLYPLPSRMLHYMNLDAPREIELWGKIFAVPKLWEDLYDT